jgi:hypothetical protein
VSVERALVLHRGEELENKINSCILKEDEWRF